MFLIVWKGFGFAPLIVLPVVAAALNWRDFVDLGKPLGALNWSTPLFITAGFTAWFDGYLRRISNRGNARSLLWRAMTGAVGQRHSLYWIPLPGWSLIWFGLGMWSLLAG